MLSLLLDAHPGWRPPPRLRAVLLGGAAASPRLFERAAARRLPIVVTYGCTETCSQVAATPYDRRFDAAACGAGRPLDGVELRIVDGRIEVRGPMRMAGYLGEPPLRPQAWFDTGDLGEIDAEGCLWLHARRADLIVTGGENVYPAEVERVLEACPGRAGGGRLRPARRDLGPDRRRGAGGRAAAAGRRDPGRAPGPAPGPTQAPAPDLLRARAAAHRSRQARPAGTGGAGTGAAAAAHAPGLSRARAGRTRATAAAGASRNGHDGRMKTIADALLADLTRALGSSPPPRVKALHLPPVPWNGSKDGEFGALELDDGSLGLSYVLLDDSLAALAGGTQARALAGADALAARAGLA